MDNKPSAVPPASLITTPSEAPPIAPAPMAPATTTAKEASPQTSAPEATTAAVEPLDRLDQIVQGLTQKATTKQSVYRNTQAAFALLRQVAQGLVNELSRKLGPVDSNVIIEYRPVNDMEFHIKFSGDLLMFVLHSNIVTFPDDYGPMPSEYVEADFRRRFFGHLMIYNFMADSIKYQRLHDPGYLVGRVLINIENHYFVEGVQQLNLPDHNLATSVVSENTMRLLIESAMIAAVNNDLLAQPMEAIEKITLKQKLDNQQVGHPTKVGFSFVRDKA